MFCLYLYYINIAIDCGRNGSFTHSRCKNHHVAIRHCIIEEGLRNMSTQAKPTNFNRM